MEIDDALYKAFLVEMEELEKFRITYSGLFPSAPLEREDQDVRRLIEAMAMFTARTRTAGQRAIARGTMRIFRQHFPYVLSPLPAMAMLKAHVDARFVDVAEIPRGAPVVLSPEAPGGVIGVAAPPAAAGEGPGVEQLHFATLAPLRLLPITLQRADILKRRAGGYRLFFVFEGAFPRSDEIGELRLYVDHLNDLMSSLTVHHYLAEHMERASISFTAAPAEDWTGRPCEVYFGAPRTPPSEIDAFEHPLQRVRSALHFPQQELFINIRVPAPPRNWQKFTICFDLDALWPAQLRLNRDAFELHATPMVNIHRQMAVPVECDGTKERYPVQHPDPGGEFRVHSVLGVYRLDSEGLIPLRPGGIQGGHDTYEVEHEGNGDKRRTWITMNLPEAFETPVRVAIDAFWHQPVFVRDAAAQYRANLFEQYLEGVRWTVLGPVMPAGDNPLQDDQEGLLHLLSIKNQRFLELNDVRFLIDALGISGERHLRDVAAALESVEVLSKPFAKSSTGFKYIYRLTMATLHTSLLPVVDIFCAKLLDILRAWSTEDVVELELSVPSLATVTLYPKEAGK